MKIATNTFSKNLALACALMLGVITMGMSVVYAVTPVAATEVADDMTPVGTMEATATTTTTTTAVAGELTAAEPDNEKDERVDFWAKDFQAKWLAQTQPTEGEYFSVMPGDTVTVVAEFENTGVNTWYQDGQDRQVCINIYKDQNVQSAPEGTGYDDPANAEKFGRSYWAHESWAVEDYRISCIGQGMVATGESGTFSMTFQIPVDAPAGTYREDITLAAGPYWVESVPETADPIGAAHIWVGFEVQGSDATPTVTATVTATPAEGAADAVPADVEAIEAYAFEYLNDLRTTAGVDPLALNADLSTVARAQTDYMKDEGGATAFGPDDTALFEAMKDAIQADPSNQTSILRDYTSLATARRVEAAGLSCPTCGEDVASSTLFVTDPDPYGRAIRSANEIIGLQAELSADRDDNRTMEAYSQVGIGVSYFIDEENPEQAVLYLLQIYKD